MNRIQWRMVGGAALLLSLMTAVPPLSAHGGGVLEVDRSSAAPGDTLGLRATKLDPGAAYELCLVGTLRSYPLGEAKADSAGAFRLEVTIPDTASAGMYRLEAVGPDGDVDAKTAVALVDAASGSAPRSARGGASGGRAEAHARADEIVVRRSRSGIEWAIIGLLIGFSAGVGVGLLARKGAGP